MQWMERRLLGGQTVEQRDREKEIGALAVVHCSEDRAKLRRCFRNSWLGWCSKEQKAFWDCFNKVNRTPLNRGIGSLNKGTGIFHRRGTG